MGLSTKTTDPLPTLFFFFFFTFPARTLIVKEGEASFLPFTGFQQALEFPQTICHNPDFALRQALGPFLVSRGRFDQCRDRPKAIIDLEPDFVESFAFREFFSQGIIVWRKRRECRYVVLFAKLIKLIHGVDQILSIREFGERVCCGQLFVEHQSQANAHEPRSSLGRVKLQ
jgi:hypothetical protein